MTRNLALVLPALLLSACVTTTTSSRTWGDPYGQGWARYGHVESVRETVHDIHAAGLRAGRGLCLAGERHGADCTR